MDFAQKPSLPNSSLLRMVLFFVLGTCLWFAVVCMSCTTISLLFLNNIFLLLTMYFIFKAAKVQSSVLQEEFWGRMVAKQCERT